jgi:2-hydroxy-3-keto-5-methylthiopentenyl-1-phosphate phosphatase
LEQYRQGKITVGDFNTRACAMVKADRQSMLNLMKGKVEIRQGFADLLSLCENHDFKFIIVSNGLDFYIQDILMDLDIKGIEVIAARTQFDTEGLKVQYIGPDGEALLDNFKLAYTRLFLDKGYDVVYIGNGISDFTPASYCSRVFATGELLDTCRRENLECTSFDELSEVVRELELL